MSLDMPASPVIPVTLAQAFLNSMYRKALVVIVTDMNIRINLVKRLHAETLYRSWSVLSPQLKLITWTTTFCS